MIPSPEPQIQNGHTEPLDETLAVVAKLPSADALTVREEVLTEEVIPIIEMSPLTEDELEDMAPTVEGPGNKMLSKTDMCTVMDVPVEGETPVTELTHTSDVDNASHLLVLDKSSPMMDKSKHREEMNVQDQQDTSFESLPAYLPSTSWLADFDNVYYCSKLPPTPKKQSRPPGSHGLDVPSRRRKLDLEYIEQSTIRKPKERYKPKGKVDRQSFSDHECCLSRKINENGSTPSVLKMERLCTRCLAKHRICTSASPGHDSQTLKQKAVPFHQRNNTHLPTCEACQSYSRKPLIRNGSSLDIHGHHHGHDTEGESSENSSCRTHAKWRVVDDPRKLNDLKRPLASRQNLEKYPAAMYPKLREKNCVCNEPQHQSIARQRLRCPHGNFIREMDENCALPHSLHTKWRINDQFYLTHGWKKGRQMIFALMSRELTCCTINLPL